MISDNEIIFRIFVAAVLGLLVGIERERRNQDAGLRTHMILVIGAALAMTISINLPIQHSPAAPTGDPARLAAQVVSGIGFLGAGVIFRSGTTVRGLTTAVSLWTMAIVGLVVGAGFYWAGIAVTALQIIILSALNYIEDHFIASLDRIQLTVWAADRPGLVEEIRAVLKIEPRGMDRITIERDLENASVVVTTSMQLWKKRTTEAISDDLAGIQGVRKVKIDN